MNKNIPNPQNGHLGGSPTRPRTFIASPYGDYQQRIDSSVAAYLKGETIELVEMYNQNLRTGPFGVNAQNLAMVALHRAFLKRFGKSPMNAEHDLVVTLTHYIMLEGDSWAFVHERN